MSDISKLKKLLNNPNVPDSIKSMAKDKISKLESESKVKSDKPKSTGKKKTTSVKSKKVTSPKKPVAKKPTAKKSAARKKAKATASKKVPWTSVVKQIADNEGVSWHKAKAIYNRDYAKSGLSMRKILEALKKDPDYLGKLSSEPIDQGKDRDLKKDLENVARTRIKRKSPTYGKPGGAKNKYYYEYRMNRRDINQDVRLDDGGEIDFDNVRYVPVNEVLTVRTKDGKIYHNGGEWGSGDVVTVLSGLYISDKPVRKEADTQMKLEFEEGGELPKTAKYIKRYDITKVEVGDKNDSKETIDGKYLIGGVWIDDFRNQEKLERAKKEGAFDKPKKKSSSNGDRDSIKGLKKLSAKRFGQSIEYIYHDTKTNRFYFIDQEGDVMEVKNLYFLKQIREHYGLPKLPAEKDSDKGGAALVVNVTREEFAKGGKVSDFDKLADKVAKNYEGEKVPKKYQKEYGKRYSKKEAQEVGDKVAATVYRKQQGKMEKGGEVSGSSSWGIDLDW